MSPASAHGSKTMLHDAYQGIEQVSMGVALGQRKVRPMRVALKAFRSTGPIVLSDCC